MDPLQPIGPPSRLPSPPHPVLFLPQKEKHHARPHGVGVSAPARSTLSRVDSHASRWRAHAYGNGSAREGGIQLGLRRLASNFEQSRDDSFATSLLAETNRERGDGKDTRRDGRGGGGGNGAGDNAWAHARRHRGAVQLPVGRAQAALGDRRRRRPWSPQHQTDVAAKHAQAKEQTRIPKEAVDARRTEGACAAEGERAVSPHVVKHCKLK